jgi:hypothetical protein
MVFIPSVDRQGNAIPRGQKFWVEACLEVVGRHFGGATAFPPGRGVWRDDETGELLFEDTVIVLCYAAEDDLAGDARQALYDFLMWLGAEGNQGEVGLYVNGDYFGFDDFGADEIDGKEAAI